MPLHRRHLLALGATALAAPAFLRHARAADLPRFALGVASGQPLADRLVLWTRLTGPDLPAQVPVDWVIAHDEACTQVAARGTEQALAADAHSVHAEPAGLEAGRGYFYRFSALGQTSPVARTRTAPAPDAPATLRAVLASCQRWDSGHWAAWRHAAAQAPDLVLFVGDYIYETAAAKNAVRTHDQPLVRTLAQFRDRYALYKSDPALQAAHAAAPWLVLWDDHEVENDYANDRGQRLAGPALLALRAAGYQAWWEHMPVPKAMRPVGSDARIHHRLDWGRLARIHALDTRQFRDHQACLPAGRVGGGSTVHLADCPDLLAPQRSLLGATQERWLADGWDLQRRWNLLAQQTLMARLDQAAPGTSGNRYRTDGWDGYPAARARLLQGVADRRVPNVVALGGDLHAHYVADLKADFDDTRAPVLASEICGTSISSLGPDAARTQAVLARNPHLHHARGDQRGYVLLTLDDRQLAADLMAVADAADPASAVSADARFVVEAGRPGPQRA
jgi:alkaline phosphatase D